MQMNLGRLDRFVRVFVAFILLSLSLFLPNPLKWFGLLGLIPLTTALFRWCPLYALFGLSTCPTCRTK
jgi:Protein of unknown function (DUF2892)